MSDHDQKLLEKISSEADKKARARDLETEINLAAVVKEEAKANAQGLIIIRKKGLNKARRKWWRS